MQRVVSFMVVAFAVQAGAALVAGCGDGIHDQPADSTGGDAVAVETAADTAADGVADLFVADVTPDADAMLSDAEPGEVDAADDADASEDTAPDVDVPPEVAPVKGKIWNVLVYMVADNNLEKSGITDLQEMMALPKSDNVIFHVQTDRAKGFYQLGLDKIEAWEGTKRLVIKDGKVTEAADLGEVNMGAAKALKEFIEWGVAAAPSAERKMLILWNHGHGWLGFGGDDFDHDELTLPEIVTGTADGMKAATLTKWDVLGFDACLMGDLSVIYQIRNFANWLIASQDFEPDNGWNYKSFQEVIDDPEMEPKAFAEKIASDYREHSLENGKVHSVTLSVLDAAKVGALYDAFLNFADGVRTSMVDATGAPDPTKPLVVRLSKVRPEAQRFGRSPDPKHDYHMVDLVDLAKRLAVEDATLQPQVDALAAAMQAVVKKRISGSLTKGSNGLSIYFPEQQPYYLSAFDAVPGFEPWRKALQALYEAGAKSASNAPSFAKTKCAGCIVGAEGAKPACIAGALAAAKPVEAGAEKQIAKAEMLIGYEGASGELQVISKVPAKIDATGKVQAQWSQEVLVVRQAAKSAVLMAQTTIDGIEAIHEVPILVAGPAACACVLPGDAGFWDTDADGSANCVDLDDDGDGVADAKDDCPFVADPGQSDANKNGKGDACEVADNAPKPKCQPDPVAPYGPERPATLVVSTHRIQNKTLTVSFYVTSSGGVSEETLKGFHRMRPMVLKAAKDTGDFKWGPGDPLAMRLDQPLDFEYLPLAANWDEGVNGVPKAGADGKPVSLLKSLGLKDVFMQLLITGAGGFGDGSYWKGNPQEGVGPCPPVDPKDTFCAKDQVVDCDGKCWPADKWGDNVCDAGQLGTPNFYCEAREFDKGACSAPECPAEIGLVRDCTGKCNMVPSYKGDKTCHDGANAATPDLVCPKYAYDGGDCPCAKGCFGHGACAAGVCTCAGGWTGTYCDTPPSCGDGKCAGPEQCTTCEKDCGTCPDPCGNKACEPAKGETCGSCPGDCGACACGDGKCNAGTEDCTSCGKDCGSCPICGDEICEVWTAQAKFAKAKGERCDTCPNDCGACQGECCAVGTALANSSFVGGGCSDPVLTKCVCDKENACCVTGWSAACLQIAKADCALNCCVASCAGKVCGPDGCGGSCGSCDDGVACTIDLCDAATGKCGTAPALGPCDDGDPCTVNTLCAAGKCAGGQPNCIDDMCQQQTCDKGTCGSTGPTDCDDKNGCTDDSCQPSKGCIHLPNAATCSDSDACTGGDACKDAVCAPGAATTCDDGNVCTKDTCSPATGACSFVKTADGLDCSDGKACTAGDKCAAGFCGPGQPKPCNDSNLCTDDVCDEAASGCTSKANTAACNDGDACTSGEACTAAACEGGTPAKCDDANPCTDDSCQPAKGCIHLPNAATCSDGDACTGGDACKDAVCAPGAATACDDGNACTGDACAKANGCTNLPNAATCSDGSACTLGDTCQVGACAAGGEPLKCDDGNLCTDDVCDEAASGCTSKANTAACNDGDACTSGEACTAAACKGGTPAKCDDANPCSDDSCQPAEGCIHLPNAATCSDDDACTLEDLCGDNACTGSAVSCDDSNPCTDDACDKVDGCAHTANKAVCDDGQACTKEDACAAKTCVGTALNCGTLKVFVTSSTTSGGSLGGVSGADAICMSDASKPAGGATYKALLVATGSRIACTTANCGGGSSEGTDWALKPSLTYSRVDGTVIGTTSAAGIFAFSLTNSVGAVAVNAWTGLATDWTKVGINNCTSWADNGASGRVGSVTSVTDTAIALGDMACGTNKLSLICVEQPCGPGQQKPCNDSNPCTDDACDEVNGCVHTANKAVCDDGQACTKEDACAAKTCAGTALNCDDGNSCTNDSCDVAGVCAHLANTA
ncbi:MAG: DUF1554 domain-containing protein, partial [Myxococcales bacterium]|nr:DUF1554 domain-containing protein [Myxococcales bacterium]